MEPILDRMTTDTVGALSSTYGPILNKASPQLTAWMTAHFGSADPMALLGNPQVLMMLGGVALALLIVRLAVDLLPTIGIPLLGFAIAAPILTHVQVVAEGNPMMFVQTAFTGATLGVLASSSRARGYALNVGKLMISPAHSISGLFVRLALIMLGATVFGGFFVVPLVGLFGYNLFHMVGAIIGFRIQRARRTLASGKATPNEG